MKKWIVLLLLLLPLTAWADPARDVTAEVQITVAGRQDGLRTMWDRDWKTGLAAPGDIDQYVWITPGEDPVAAVYIEYGMRTSAVALETYDGSDWRQATEWTDALTAQDLVSFPARTEAFRLHFTPAIAGSKLYIREIYVFTEGDLTDTPAHGWTTSAGKADILFVATHPDDELLWFGGAIPSCTDAGREVQVAYLTCNKLVRRQELLNGLWHCGVTRYPEINEWEDARGEPGYVLWTWGGRDNALSQMTAMLRRYQPEVVVTHGVKGESGHIQHKLCSELMQEAVRLAADPAYQTDGLSPWQVKKLYLHGGKEPTLQMDWSQPLASFGGKDGLTVAREAFDFHVSQDHVRYHVQSPGEENDSTLFTLVYSTVGEDEAGNDFFEHIVESDR